MELQWGLDQARWMRSLPAACNSCQSKTCQCRFQDGCLRPPRSSTQTCTRRPRRWSGWSSSEAEFGDLDLKKRFYFSDSKLKGVTVASMTRWLDYLFNIWPFTTFSQLFYLQKFFQYFSKFKINPQKFSIVFLNFAKVAIFCQVWSHWLLVVAQLLPQKSQVVD